MNKTEMVTMLLKGYKCRATTWPDKSYYLEYDFHNGKFIDSNDNVININLYTSTTNWEIFTPLAKFKVGEFVCLIAMDIYAKVVSIVNENGKYHYSLRFGSQNIQTVDYDESDLMEAY